MDSITDIGVIGIVLIVVVILLLIDVNIQESPIQENFDVSGIDSSEILEIANNYYEGSLTFNNVNATYFNLLPKGSIVMFHGTTIPTGWVICDGKSGTPDLIDRIPMGDNKSGNKNGPRLSATGTAKSTGGHTHTMSESKRNDKCIKDVTGVSKKSKTGIYATWTETNGEHSHTIIANNVSSIYPDRTTVIFIMKL